MGSKCLSHYLFCIKTIATFFHGILTATVKSASWKSATLTATRKWRCLNPLNPELNLICYLLALLGAHHFLHVSRIMVKSLPLRLLMSYIYIYIYIYDINSLRVNLTFTSRFSSHKEIDTYQIQFDTTTLRPVKNWRKIFFFFVIWIDMWHRVFGFTWWALLTCRSSLRLHGVVNCVYCYVYGKRVQGGWV